MTGYEPTVFIVDDDTEVRDALRLLMKSCALQCAAFDSAQAFLDNYDPDSPGCLVLDIRMPGLSGLDLQHILNQQQALLPIIFITGHGDIPMAVDAMRSGAIDFIQKPFRDQDLIARINQALAQAAVNHSALLEHNTSAQRLEHLTPRERQIMERVVDGKANKVIAIELNLSPRTVEIHRARVMYKMRARSVPQLIAMVRQAEKSPQ